MRSVWNTIHPALLGLVWVLLAAMPMDLAARGNSTSRSLVWTHQTDRLGRYTGRYLYVAKGINVTFGANYYYGDIDYTGRAFNAGFLKDNFSGGINLTYQHPLGSYFDLRSSVGAGILRGMADSIYKGFPMNFQSIYLEPSMCVDYYPFSRLPEYWLGLYLFVGIGVNAGFVHYDFGNPPGSHITGDAFRLLPIVPFGIGWAIPMTRASGLMLHVELSLHQGIFDTPVMNLDAYPQTKSQNGVRDYGMSRKNNGKRTNEWADGYFQAALTLSYRWN